MSGLDLPDVGGDLTAVRTVDIFDTTLRDGAQFEGISLTVEDKLRVAEQLDWLGVAWIEGGYPQANPKDAEFFRRAAAGELELSTATLVAFGSTRRPAGRVDEDPTLAEYNRYLAELAARNDAAGRTGTETPQDRTTA